MVQFIYFLKFTLTASDNVEDKNDELKQLPVVKCNLLLTNTSYKVRYQFVTPEWIGLFIL